MRRKHPIGRDSQEVHWPSSGLPEKRAGLFQARRRVVYRIDDLDEIERTATNRTSNMVCKKRVEAPAMGQPKGNQTSANPVEPVVIRRPKLQSSRDCPEARSEHGFGWLPALRDAKPVLIPGDGLKVWLKTRWAARKQRCYPI